MKGKAHKKTSKKITKKSKLAIAWILLLLVILLGVLLFLFRSKISLSEKTGYQVISVAEHNNYQADGYSPLCGEATAYPNLKYGFSVLACGEYRWSDDWRGLLRPESTVVRKFDFQVAEKENEQVIEETIRDFIGERHPAISSFEVFRDPRYEELLGETIQVYHIDSDDLFFDMQDTTKVPDEVEGGWSFLGGYSFIYFEERPDIFFYAYTEGFVDIFFETITFFRFENKLEF